LDGLHLYGWNQRTFQVHPQVLEIDQSFRQSSLEAGNIFGQMDPAELKKLHENFITACGGKLEIVVENEKVKPDKTVFEKIRETHPNAYRPWDTDQDAKLDKLFKENVPVKQLAEIFGRKTGGVRSRLVKLGLISKDETTNS